MLKFANMKKGLGVMLAALAILTATITVAACAGMGGNPNEVRLTILATTDLHGRIFPWEYASGSEQQWGLGKIATLINQERNAARRSPVILVDNGDTIESNMIHLFNEERVHPMIQGLNALRYDTWNLGNHEFNFGLDVLGRAINSFNGTVLSANIMRDDGSYFVEPYTIINRGGVRVGIIGLIAPHIPRWEAGAPEHFAGLNFLDPLEKAKEYVDHLRNVENVDVIIGTFHLGETSEGYNDFTDSARALVEAVPGIDAVVLGHSHATMGASDNQVFFGDTIVVQPENYGTSLGKITIDLVRGEDGRFAVTNKSTDLLPVADVAPDARFLRQLQFVDDRSRAAAEVIVGRATGDFVPPDSVRGIPEAQIRSTAFIDLINRVQMFYTGADVSGAALFDSRANLLEGDLRFMDMVLIYRYSNTLQAHRVNGAGLRQYMEWSARFYNTQVEGDVTISFNEDIRAYNLDMLLGVDYEIDIRRPAGDRIRNLTFNGAPVRDTDQFVLAVNNYRAGTLQSLGILQSDIRATMTFDSLDTPNPEMQELIRQYIIEELNGVVEPTVANNWRIIRNDYSNLEGANEAIALINAGIIVLPSSADGRTPNVRSINVLQTATPEYIAELAAAANVDPSAITGTNITTGNLYRQIHALLNM